MPDRFFCPEPIVNGQLTLDREESRHLARVRRVRVGERVEVFDGRGLGYLAEVARIDRDEVLLTILEDRSGRVPPIELTLATAVPKGDRFDWLIEKATELGVSRLRPLQTERATVDPRDAKLDRLRRRVIEASKQCGRYRLMEIENPIAWGDFLETDRHAKSQTIRLLAHPDGVPIDRLQLPERFAAASLAIGPEGGFSDAEIAVARDVGWHVVSLSPTILRIETAALAGVAIVMARGGRWTDGAR